MSDVQWENDSIRQKIEGLHNLPEGYEPRLDSKWELLEASLNESRKKSAFWPVYIRRIASGLLLLLVAAPIWWFYQPVEKPQAIPPIKNTALIINTPSSDTVRQLVLPVPVNTVVVIPKQSGREKKHIPKNNPDIRLLVENYPIAQQKITESAIDSSALTPAYRGISPDTGVISISKKNRHTRRYEEFDFGTPVNAEPAPATVRQGIQVRLGQPLRPASSEHSPTEPAIRLKF